MSLLTAIVLKVMIDLINYCVDRVQAFFGDKEGAAAQVLRGLSSWAIMFFSKVLILLVVQIIFEEDVDLGSFFNVLVLVMTMMAARQISHVVFERLGDSDPDAVRDVAPDPGRPDPA